MERSLYMIALGAMLCWAGCSDPTEPATEPHIARVYIEPRIDGVRYVVTIDGDTTNAGFSTAPMEVIITWRAPVIPMAHVAGAEIGGATATRGDDAISEKGR